MKMNKKGFIFTFISVILISVIVLAFLIQYSSRTKINIERTNTEVETMNSFIKSLNNDYMPRAMEISGNQAVLALLNCMDSEVECNYIEGYLDNEGTPETKIRDVLYSGSYNIGENPMELMEINNFNYNITNTLNEIITLANYTGIDLTIDNFDENSITISQTDPWNIDVSMEISYSIKNKNNDVSWVFPQKTLTGKIPIHNFRDPIYLVESGLDVALTKTTYNLPSEVNEHAEFTNFLACSESPSFFQRMTGLSGFDPENPSGFGIESLLEEIQSPLFSAIDYQYLMEQNPDSREIIPGSDYYIDSTHCTCYNFEC